MTYNPEIYYESTLREIKRYIDSALVGSLADAYEVIMEFPGPLLDARKVPFVKSLIHFEVDDIRTMPVGIGDNIYNWNYDVDTQTVNPQEARRHEFSFDVGVWAFDKSGGTTARMRARQLLDGLFAGSLATNKLRDFTDGGDGCLEIISFSGGRNVNDTVNDVPVYRTVNGTLEVRVFSRTPLLDTPIPAIEEIGQNPGLSIIG